VADLAIVAPKDRTAWRRWLQRHHTRTDGVWLLIRKKGSPAPGVGYEDAVEEALCFGWIDATSNRHDGDHYRLWVAPRKPRSVWAASNKARVERLIAEGRMAPPGLAKVEAAKADGSWQALDGLEDLTIPDDLSAALDATPPAREHFEAFPPGARKQILFWIRDAKRPQTRAARVTRTAEAAARNIRVNEWRPKDGA
jgi:uncharacterized protein YdeI (YjbR/CyaY-like superfamily)